jgi:hypothetical protein
MANFNRLHDLYRFPGFVPLPQVRGVFGDCRAVLVTLRRRRKKRPVACVVTFITPTTTSGHAASAISRVATNAFTSPSLFAGSGASGVAP